VWVLSRCADVQKRGKSGKSVHGIKFEVMPRAVLKPPDVQGVHMSEEVPPWLVEYVPAAQLRHLNEPVLVE
jgi:hypothetical protein